MFVSVHLEDVSLEKIKLLKSQVWIYILQKGWKLSYDPIPAPIYKKGWNHTGFFQIDNSP